MILIGILSFLAMIAIFFLVEFISSISGKKYIGYTPPKRTYSLGHWFYSSWNFIGPKKFSYSTNIQRHHPVRRIGVRWFGFEWEKEIEIPMGELRF